MSLRATIAIASACIGASTFIGVPLSMPVSIAGKELTEPDAGILELLAARHSRHERLVMRRQAVGYAKRRNFLGERRRGEERGSRGEGRKERFFHREIVSFYNSLLI